MKDKVQAWLAQQLGQQFQLDPLLALVIVAIVSATFGLAGRMLWSLIKWCSSRYFYGGWVLEVKNGKSGRHWKMPIEVAIIRSLKQHDYLAFKRDLGTAFSGEGNVNFSFGVLVSESMKKCEPQAPGLLIDSKNRRIIMDYAQSGNVMAK